MADAHFLPAICKRYLQQSRDGFDFNDNAGYITTAMSSRQLECSMYIEVGNAQNAYYIIPSHDSMCSPYCPVHVTYGFVRYGQLIYTYF